MKHVGFPIPLVEEENKMTKYHPDLENLKDLKRKEAVSYTHLTLPTKA